MDIDYNGLKKMFQPDVRPLLPPLIFPACQQELIDLLPDNKQKTTLKKQMKKRLAFYESNRDSFWQHRGYFEQVKKADAEKGLPALFSFRFNQVSDLNNLRILFVLNDHRMVLITAFFEKRTSDYHHAIAVAQERIKKA